MFTWALGVTLLSFIYLLLKWKHSYWSRRGIVQLKPTVLLGNFKDALLMKIIPNQIVVDAYHKFQQSGVKHGGIYFLYLPLWIPVDEDLIKQILYKDFWYFAGHGFFYQHKGDILSQHLFNAEGEQWKQLRHKLSPAFSSGKLKLMFNLLSKLGDRLENKVKAVYHKGEPLDIKEVAACFGTDVIASCAFGIECNTLENPHNDFRKYGRMIFEPRFVDELLEYFFDWDLLNFFGHTWMKKDVNNFFINLVKELIDYRDKNKVQSNDFLQILLQLRFKENVENGDEANTLSFEEIAANVFVMYAAGFETTSTTTSFIMYELAKNPDIQEKVRQEIWSIVKNRPDHNITYEDLQQMKYTEMVINETLRIHTVATEVPRKCTSDYKVPGSDVVIEKGTFVLIPSWAIHNDPRYFPNPKQFNPENFSEASKAARKHFSYFPFGEGQRLCIGYRFAMMQIKLAISRYLKHYKYELNEKTPRNISYEANTVTIVPKGQVLLDILKLDSV